MENRKLKLVQVVTIIGETYTFENPTEEGYNSELEQYYVKIGSDITVFPREAVVAFRSVYDDSNEETNKDNNDTEIVSLFKDLEPNMREDIDE